MYRHIIWDWNGTILDDVDACVNSINRMLAARNLPLVTRQRYLEVFDFPVIDYYRQLGFNLEQEDWDAVAREFHRHYAIYSRATRLREDSVATIRRLRKQGITSSILSACEITILERMLAEHNIRNLFETVYGLDNLYAASKLDQGHRLMQTLNMPPAEILLVGDTNHDLEVAAQLGVDCILLAGGHQARERLKASRVLASATQLPAECAGTPVD